MVVFGVIGMDWQAIGAVGEIAGAVAVFVTLIFLTLQMKQNTRTTRAILRQNISQAAIASLYVGIDDESFSDVFYRAWWTHGEITEAEAVRFRRFIIAAWRSSENAFHQFRDGFYPVAEWEGTISTTVSFTRRGGSRVREYWNESKAIFDPEFVTEFELRLG